MTHENISKDLHPLTIPISGLQPDAGNARKHGAKNLQAIEASLAKFGQRKPIVVQRKGMIVRAGNGTLAAAIRLGWEKIAAVVVDDDDKAAAQYAVADNRAAELAEWDADALALSLEGWGSESASVGFDTADVDGLLSSLMGDREEQIAQPSAARGPVFVMPNIATDGSLRSCCGSST